MAETFLELVNVLTSFVVEFIINGKVGVEAFLRVFMSYHLPMLFYITRYTSLFNAQ